MQAPPGPQGPQPTGNPAVRYGFMFGVILAAISVVSAIIQWTTGAYAVRANPTSLADTNIGPALLLGCLGFLLILALTFVAGMRASGETGKVGAGAIAGLIAGLIGAAVGLVIGIVVLFSITVPNAVAPATTKLTPDEYRTALIIGGIVGSVLGLLLDAGIGAGLGALGGLVGVNNYRKAQPATMYSGIPYAGYPPYSGTPGYPPPPYPGAPGYPNAPQGPQSPYPAPPEQPPYGTPPVGPQ